MNGGQSQLQYTDSIYEQDIYTVLLRNSDWEQSPPVFELNSGQQLELLFDDLSGNYRSLGYTVIHCDPAWNPSSINPQQYLQGFHDSDIREMHPSFNTTMEYMHYRLLFPNDDVQVTASGNYVIVVYERNNPDHIILTRRFYVMEPLMNIEGRFTRPQGLFYDSGQQPEFTVSDPSGLIRDVNTELMAVVRQNGRHDSEIILPSPRMVRPGVFEYGVMDRLIFAGGNEFRNLDIKSMKYQSANIASIEFENPYFHVYLKPDEIRENAPYFFHEDLNGRFYIERENAIDKHWEADYVFVHFFLESFYPLDGSVHVFGQLTGMKANAGNRMEYKNNAGRYELTLLLKQGWYDYQYVYVVNGKIDETRIEGSHYETENTYSVFLYYMDHLRDYTRLVGFSQLTAK